METEGKLAQVNDTVDNMLALNDQLTESVKNLTEQKQALWVKLQEMESREGEYFQRFNEYNSRHASMNSDAMYKEGEETTVTGTGTSSGTEEEAQWQTGKPSLGGSGALRVRERKTALTTLIAARGASAWQSTETADKRWWSMTRP